MVYTLCSCACRNIHWPLINRSSVTRHRSFRNRWSKCLLCYFVDCNNISLLSTFRVDTKLPRGKFVLWGHFVACKDISSWWGHFELTRNGLEAISCVMTFRGLTTSEWNISSPQGTVSIRNVLILPWALTVSFIVTIMIVFCCLGILGRQISNFDFGKHISFGHVYKAPYLYDLVLQ